jgi:hypothetical protein
MRIKPTPSVVDRCHVRIGNIRCGLIERGS